MEWGRLSEKSNIPQRESRIRFWPCVGVRSILVSRGLLGQPGGWAQKQFVRKNLPFPEPKLVKIHLSVNTHHFPDKAYWV